ncbi:MAG: OmpA family protein [Moraxella sp.]|nr:OmpA family protein [Moraxella sp.]
MDIVQYLHGLVSPTLGIHDGDPKADLLKQYYALSVCHMAQRHDDISILTGVSALWGEQTQDLIKRFSRSFHLPDTQISSWLDEATPTMINELLGLLGEHALSDMLAQQGVGELYLPAWAGEFIGGQFVSTTHQPSADTEPLQEMADVSDDEISQEATQDIAPKPSARPKKIRPIAWGLGALVLMAMAGVSVGAWKLYQKSQIPSETAQQTLVSSGHLNPPRLLLTTGENGTLYGCLAEVGDNALQTRFVQILQKNFGQVECIIDIDGAFGSSLVGLERLESIIAMMKSEPFTSIEIVGGQIMVNHPETNVLNRMVGDIGLLAPQFMVSAVPPLDKSTVINDSIDKAMTALNVLDNTATPYQLVRAINLQHIDFYGTTELSELYHAPLALFAQKLISNPSIKLIIASHTDTTNPDMSASVALSQAQAQTVKNFLVSQGVSDGQLVVKGVGSAFPIADNVTQMGQFKNRRVEFLVHDEETMAWLSDKVTKATTPTTYERPQMVESAPYVPSETSPVMFDEPSQPMSVQGMPPVILPEPAYSAPQPVINDGATAVAQTVSPSTSGDGAYVGETHTIQSQESTSAQNQNQPVPQEVLELSETSIGSDGVMRGQSFEIRR